jgi:hypothetical protein
MKAGSGTFAFAAGHIFRRVFSFPFSRAKPPESLMKILPTLASVAVAACLLAGCAVSSVKPGMTREEVIAGYGRPTGIVPISTGTRLQYSRQPRGQSVVMVDLDANGKVVSAKEVLTPAEFAKVEIGKWTRRDIEREFGPPAIVDRVASWPSDIMTYRWRDTVTDMFFFVYLDAANVVQRTGQGMEIPTMWEID